MKRSLNLSLCFVCVFLFSSVELVVAAGGGEPTGVGGLKFPLPLEVYHQLEAAKAAELGRSLGIWETLSLRAA
ncbi:MAG: hypothetical protein NZL93_04025, partial [Chthoniobacterales bacterium]|nr:hypothetical protein [Chthoniobacterales bacterium]